MLIEASLLLVFSFVMPIYVYVKSKTTGYLLVGFATFLGTSTILLSELSQTIVKLDLNLSNLMPTPYLLELQFIDLYTPWWLALSLAGFGQAIKNESAYFKAVALTPLAYVPLIIVAESVETSPLSFFLLVGGILLSYVALILVNGRSSYTRIVGGLTEMVSSVAYGFELYLSGLVSQASKITLGGVIGFVEITSLEVYTHVTALIQQKKMIAEEGTSTLERIRTTAERIEAIQNALTVSTYTSRQEKMIEYIEKAKSETEELRTNS